MSIIRYQDIFDFRMRFTNTTERCPDMPIRHSIWRVVGKPRALKEGRLRTEAVLEEMIDIRRIRDIYRKGIDLLRKYL